MTIDSDAITPKELAHEIGISPRTLRASLRENGFRPEAEKHARWVLTEDQCDAARRRWPAEQNAGPSLERDLNDLAQWSAWGSFDEASARAPLMPGVYLLRLPETRQVVYVGMAGERRGKGVRGRLSMYRRGKAATSGFGEAVLDRALADRRFVEQQLAHLDDVGPRRTAQWAKDAIEWFAPEVCWATTATGRDALELEADVERLLRAHGIWNRPRNLD
jgi:hypothetical protein